MSRAPHLLLTGTALTLALAVPSTALADDKPADVHDPTLGQAAPADAAERILRTSHLQPRKARRVGKGPGPVTKFGKGPGRVTKFGKGSTPT